MDYLVTVDDPRWIPSLLPSQTLKSGERRVFWGTVLSNESRSKTADYQPKLHKPLYIFHDQHFLKTFTENTYFNAAENIFDLAKLPSILTTSALLT